RKRVVDKQNEARRTGVEAEVFDLLLDAVLVKKKILDPDRILFFVLAKCGDGDNGTFRIPGASASARLCER
ncbi:MAG: hypothetical protein ABR530_07390, partial [Pyrinomonadaceae bacterium]